MKKVIYISYQPITLKFYSDYYVGNCIEKGFDVEYWDISKLYFPKISFESSLDFIGVRKILSFHEFKELLSKVDLEFAIFITNITYEFKVWRLFLLLSSSNCTLVAFGRGMYPSPKKTKNSKIQEIILTFDLNRMFTGLRNSLSTMLKRYQFVKTYDFIFRSGSEGYLTLGFGNHYDLNSAKVINVNYFDYDKFLESINGITLIDKEYCVFLDEYLPYHPDISITGIKTVSAENYYPKLNKFFDFIESKCNISVIIAAHPKAHKYKSENLFNGREIFFNKTCELVRDSMFVITHHSSSISFPILFRKPIFFISSQEQKTEMPQLYELTFHLSDVLNSSVIHFDSYNGEDITLKVDFEKYDDYKYKYLTSKESENRQSSEIFIEAILQI